MWIYLICFMISCLLLKLAEKTSQKLIYKILVGIALIIPCLLAGLRADTIGTDVNVYVKPMFELACSSTSFLDYLDMRWMASWTYKYVSDIEMGFTVLVYCIAKIFGKINVLLTCIEILIIVPFYKGIYYFKKEISVWLCMLTFYLINYNVTLNMMRQWIAMAFVLYGFRYIIEKKPLKFIVINLLAMTFHKSSIFGFLFYLIYKYIYSNKKEKNLKIVISSGRSISFKKLNKVFVLTIVGLIVLLSLNIIISILNRIGLSRYSLYITGSLHILPIQIILRIPFIIIIFLNWERYSEKYKMAPFFLTIMIMDLFMSQLGSISIYSSRISIYFSMFNCIAYSSICEISGKREIRAISKILLIAYLIIYWIYYFVIRGFAETIPYQFA